MTVRELYENLGANYDDVLLRFGSDARITRFIPLFVKDPSCALLQASVEAQDWEGSFRAVHTIKGVAANMSFTALYDCACALTEHLRGNKPLTDRTLYDNVCAEYDKTISEIAKLMGE